MQAAKSRMGKSQMTAVDISNSFSFNMAERDKNKLFSMFLSSQNGRGTWGEKINRRVTKQYYKCKNLFDINDPNDLCQNVQIALFKFFCKKEYEIVNEAMLTACVMKIIKRSLQTITRERYYDKRKITQRNGRSIYYRDALTSFDDSMDKDDANGTKISDATDVSSVDPSCREVIVDAHTLNISDGEKIGEKIDFDQLISKCKRRMTPFQFKIFYKCFVRGDSSLSELAVESGFTTSNIIQIKNRHIIPILKKALSEMINGENDE